MNARIEAMRRQLAVLHPTYLDIVDESHRHAGHAGARAGGGHYVVHIVSENFLGSNTMTRHRMIYSALAEMLKCEIHALTLHTHTPDEYKLLNLNKELSC
jgi:BolA protein